MEDERVDVGEEMRAAVVAVVDAVKAEPSDEGWEAWLSHLMRQVGKLRQAYDAIEESAEQEVQAGIRDHKRINNWAWFQGTIEANLTRHTECDCSVQQLEEEELLRKGRLRCGCGRRHLSMNRPRYHWLGEHWSSECAFEKAVRLVGVLARQNDEVFEHFLVKVRTVGLKR